MFTTSVFVHAQEVPEAHPCQVAIIWKRQYGVWDFFTRSPIEEAEGIVATDAFLTGLDRSCYEVKQG
jgi:hypothetical protein